LSSLNAPESVRFQCQGVLDRMSRVSCWSIADECGEY
jgi:hypothetical protein